MMESLEVNSILIVESDNDKYFIESLIKSLQIELKINESICGLNDYKCLDGLSEKKLHQSIEEIKFDDYNLIGIMIDADEKGIENQIQLINRVLKQFDEDLEFNRINQVITSTKHNVSFICYIMNVAGLGELETLLRAIKSKDSIFADCLESWKSCLDSKEKKVSKKEFDKFWVSIYHRYDQCKKREQNQAGLKCNNQASFEKSIYDFNSPLLDDLKAFIELLK